MWLMVTRHGRGLILNRTLLVCMLRPPCIPICIIWFVILVVIGTINVLICVRRAQGAKWLVSRH